MENHASEMTQAGQHTIITARAGAKCINVLCMLTMHASNCNTPVERCRAGWVRWLLAITTDAAGLLPTEEVNGRKLSCSGTWARHIVACVIATDAQMHILFVVHFVLPQMKSTHIQKTAAAVI